MSSDSKSESVTLSPEQRHAIDMVVKGQNLFITGGAGTGKSFIVQEIMKQLILDKKRFALTASSGCAAVIIAGGTIHSFAGFGIRTDIPPGEIGSRRYISKIWKNLDVLIIDEISMLAPDYFEYLERVVCIARENSNKGFGGLQVVVIGDFFQLGPIIPFDKNKDDKEDPFQTSKLAFCFQTEAWQRCHFTAIILHQCFRQSNNEFISCLNRIRWGTPKDADLQMIAKQEFAGFNIDDGILPLRLFPRKRDVEDINREQLKLLPGKSLKFLAVGGIYLECKGKSLPLPLPDESEDGFEAVQLLDEYKNIYRQFTNLVKNNQAPTELRLREGAQVMLLTNISTKRKLINGTQGVVIGFEKDSGYPTVKFATGETLTVGPYSWKSHLAHNLILEIERKLKISGSRSSSKGRSQETCVYYEQIPLRLAYAITVHKSQGQTFNKVILSLKDCFGDGMVYVALSRITELCNMKIEDFKPAQIRANPLVVKFYSALGESFPVESNEISALVQSKYNNNNKNKVKRKKIKKESSSSSDDEDIDKQKVKKAKNPKDAKDPKDPKRKKSKKEESSPSSSSGSSSSSSASSSEENDGDAKVNETR